MRAYRDTEKVCISREMWCENGGHVRTRYVVMMRTSFGWQQIGRTHLTIESARDARNEYKRGPDTDRTFRIFQEVE